MERNARLDGCDGTEGYQTKQKLNGYSLPLIIFLEILFIVVL